MLYYGDAKALVAQNNRMIRAAAQCYARVSGTERFVKISKSEAMALNKHREGALTMDSDKGDLLIEG